MSRSLITVLCEAESICYRPLRRVAGLWASVDCLAAPPSHHTLGLQSCGNMPGFRQPLGDSNSGPHACKTSTLPTEPSSQCRESLLLYPRDQKAGFPPGYHVGSRVAVWIFRVNCVLKNQLEETRSRTANCPVWFPQLVRWYECLLIKFYWYSTPPWGASRLTTAESSGYPRDHVSLASWSIDLMAFYRHNLLTFAQDFKKSVIIVYIYCSWRHSLSLAVPISPAHSEPSRDLQQ